MTTDIGIPIIIREIRVNELPELLELLRAKAEFDGVAHLLVADIPALHEALFTHQPKAKALVAVLDGAIVGMATYYEIFSSFIVKPCIWLDDLYVYEAFRSKGVGRALIKHLSELANQHGYGRIDWIVATANDRGKKFYAELGATIFDLVQLARLDEGAIRTLSQQA